MFVKYSDPYCCVLCRCQRIEDQRDTSLHNKRGIDFVFLYEHGSSV